MQTFFCPHYLPKFEEFVCGLLDFQRKSIHFNVRINCSFLLALEYCLSRQPQIDLIVGDLSFIVNTCGGARRALRPSQQFQFVTIQYLPNHDSSAMGICPGQVVCWCSTCLLIEYFDT